MSLDTVDKLVVFLAKRDGIDKLVKTFQYVAKLACWHVEATRPDAAERFKKWEVASGLSRKAFRTGRSLTGFNALRRNPGATPVIRFLAVLANSGEMVYFFFDHFLWLSRIGTLDPKIAKKMSFISAFGESFGYVFFIIIDCIFIRQRLRSLKRLRTNYEPKEEVSGKVSEIQGDIVMRLMGISANVADLIIALAEIQPNPFCNHTVTLGISGLVSAWAGKLTAGDVTGPFSVLLPAIANAFALSSSVYISWNVSGGHVNPAVTFGMAVAGRISVPTAMFYWTSQMIASVMACLVLKVTVVEQHVPIYKIAGEMTGFGASVLEGVLAFVLVYTVFTANDPRRGLPLAVGPIFIGFVAGANVLAAGPFSGGAMNPACAFGSAMIYGSFKNQAVYWVGPLLGGATAALVYDNMVVVPAAEDDRGSSTGDATGV
ncbi:hypothetical protein HID58_022356 [Brassica napus]|uniref:Uncharacterized protein n=1 Tax=Brassica napus TaxID=3708 RepID=A0ABQ8CZA8_BRANA|nr:hypothetical protein HID58_022356 [Brassica napus]